MKNINRKKKLTRQNLFKLPEFWEEYIKTGLTLAEHKSKQDKFFLTCNYACINSLC